MPENRNATRRDFNKYRLFFFFTSTYTWLSIAGIITAIFVFYVFRIVPYVDYILASCMFHLFISVFFHQWFIITKTLKEELIENGEEFQREFADHILQLKKQFRLFVSSPIAWFNLGLTSLAIYFFILVTMPIYGQFHDISFASVLKAVLAGLLVLWAAYLLKRQWRKFDQDPENDNHK